MDSTLPAWTAILENLTLVTNEELSKIISCMNKTTCASDPFPTRLLMSHLPHIIDVLLHILNLCITTNVFPLSCKSSVRIPLIKKPGLNVEIKKNIDLLLYQICRFYLNLLKKLLHLVLFRTLRITPLLINFNLRTSAVAARKRLYSVCIVTIVI